MSPRVAFRPRALAACVLLSFACSSGDPAAVVPDDDLPPTIPAGFTVALEEVANGLSDPVALASPAGDSRLFITEQRGVIRIFRNGQILPTPFLDIRTRVRFGGERGLLGIAFHPQYALNGWFFLNFTGLDGETRVERFTVSGSDPDVADPASAVLALMVSQPFSNHNGGMILFAPDGMLLVGMGDGGSGGDPQGHGQNRATLLGDLLRLDVNSLPYTVPPDNPFAGQQGLRPEIWASGLRNPWRFSVDRETDLLYIADVGQNRLEEVNVAPVTTAALNYGWNVMEGTECYSLPLCVKTGLTSPVLVYNRQNGCSVIGGYVYRGNALPEIRGHYFYSDYCNAWLRSFRYHDGAAVERRDWDIPDVGPVLSFGEDSQGELYLLTSSGRIYRIIRGN